MHLPKKKLLALLLCTCLVLSLLLLLGLQTAHGDHRHCQVESCQVCACLQTADTLGKLTAAAVLLCVQALLPRPRRLSSPDTWLVPGGFCIPVLLRVRMNH